MRERENPAVIDYLKAENEYTRAIMEDTEELQDNLYEEIVGRIKQDDSTVPYKENGYFYYVRYESGGEYPFYCRKKESLDAEEEILLDGNEMAREYDYFDIGNTSISPDNNLIAYSIDTVSRRNYPSILKTLKAEKYCLIHSATQLAIVAGQPTIKRFSIPLKTRKPYAPKKYCATKLTNRKVKTRKYFLRMMKPTHAMSTKASRKNTS